MVQLTLDLKPGRDIYRVFPIHEKINLKSHYENNRPYESLFVMRKRGDLHEDRIHPNFKCRHGSYYNRANYLTPKPIIAFTVAWYKKQEIRSAWPERKLIGFSDEIDQLTKCTARPPSTLDEAKEFIEFIQDSNDTDYQIAPPRIIYLGRRTKRRRA